MSAETDTGDHRAAVAAIDPAARAKLLETSDMRGLLQLGSHWGLMLLLSVWIASGAAFWPLALLPLGILIMFQFTALHEATHQTAFRSAWLNTAVMNVGGALTLVAPQWFRFFHFAHHRHTQDPEHDPELAGGKPDTLAKYLLYLTGLSVWKANISALLHNASGRADHPYVPLKVRPRIIREARVMLAFYALLAGLSLWFHSTLLLWLWLLPALLGQPFLRAFLLAEHTRCPLVANMLANTRTTFTTVLVRFVAWNMPYHAEHHAMPQVPFWQLPSLHSVIKDRLLTTEQGYTPFHIKLLSSLVSSR